MNHSTNTPTSPSPGLFREQFPLLEEKTYLSSHTLGPVPRKTRDSLNAYLTEWNTKGIEAWSGPWWEVVENFSAEIEQLLQAKSGTVAPMTNATRGMAGVASCFSYDQSPREILMTDLEFTTSYAFWNRLEELGAEIRIVESENGIGITPEKLADAISRDTLLVATCHAYFQSGAVQDLNPVIEEAHRNGAYVLGDGYQLVGVKPVNVTSLDIDFYVGGSHKWLCGGPGAGYLYVKPDLIEELEPRLTGWFGLEDPFSFDVCPDEPGTLSSGVYRFLDGTPNVPGLYSALEGIRTVREVGPERAENISNQLTETLYEWANNAHMTVHSPEQPDNRNGMICLNFEGAEQVCNRLQERDVVVDYRPDCGIRVSAHFFNTTTDIEQFWHHLTDMAGYDS